ncbi:endonuclease YncB(thermonuclease family) [Enterobacillus tribolii]|uniref:Endonuclease YncB(Thermonuclease family) n=1 Tax=Enterobacillus tribolii TaxID=1487935 RepID=A0A370R364_9GAMM|nr:endonuclease YncB(thermonuclease family) [Enterobacillus tribolii]
MKRSIKFSLLSLLIIFMPVLPVLADVSGKVVKVLDGDTVDVLSKDSMNKMVKTRVRLAGIDAPEKKQPFGQRSRQQLSRLVGGKQVIVVGKQRDRYGRLLGTIMLDGRDINACQVRTGMAWAYRYKGKAATPAYLAPEAQARASKRGLWAQKSAVAPWEWRRAAR